MTRSLLHTIAFSILKHVRNYEGGLFALSILSFVENGSTFVEEGTPTDKCMFYLLQAELIDYEQS